MRDAEGDLNNNEDFTQRKKYTYEQYLRLTADSENSTHDFDEESPAEDPRMIALFDSLIERTQNDWASDSGSDSEVTSSRDTRVDRILNLLFDNYTSSTSESENEEEEEENNEEGETEHEPSGTFGVDVAELRRIFRRNREIVETELPNEGPRTDESHFENARAWSYVDLRENPQDLRENPPQSTPHSSEETRPVIPLDSEHTEQNVNKASAIPPLCDQTPRTDNSGVEEKDSTADDETSSDRTEGGESSSSSSRTSSNNVFEFKKRKHTEDRNYRK